MRLVTHAQLEQGASRGHGKPRPPDHTAPAAGTASQEGAGAGVSAGSATALTGHTCTWGGEGVVGRQVYVLRPMPAMVLSPTGGAGVPGCAMGGHASTGVGTGTGTGTGTGSAVPVSGRLCGTTCLPAGMGGGMPHAALPLGDPARGHTMVDDIERRGRMAWRNLHLVRVGLAPAATPTPARRVEV